MQVAELRRDYEGSKEWELKKKSIETQVASPPAKQKIGVAIATLLSPSSPPLPVESSTKLRGGPRNWPREVVEHVQSLLDLGWASAKVANHYSLQEFELSEAQVDLVRATPAPRPREPGSPPGKLLAEDAARVRALLMEGKTDAAVLQHHALLDSCVTLAQIQAIRAGLRREGAAPASPGASPGAPAGSFRADRAEARGADAATRGDHRGARGGGALQRLHRQLPLPHRPQRPRLPGHRPAPPPCPPPSVG